MYVCLSSRNSTHRHVFEIYRNKGLRDLVSNGPSFSQNLSELGTNKQALVKLLHIAFHKRKFGGYGDF